MQEAEIMNATLESEGVAIETDVAVIEIPVTEVVNMEMSEAFPATSDGDALNHALLHNRDVHDAHPISAITGLRDELDNIEALGSVFSNEKNCADYYLWEDGNPNLENRVGYFVSICDDVRTIKRCQGEDIFGVTVDAAAYIGGQNGVPYIVCNDCSYIGPYRKETCVACGSSNINLVRDYTYGLVARSGIVKVACELDVSKDDYVISNSYGVATKADGGCGCKVVAISEIDGVKCAIIALNPSASQLGDLGQRTNELAKRVSASETNIVSAINVANKAHQLAQSTNELTEEQINNIIKKVEEATAKSDSALEATDNMEDVVSQTQVIAAQARALAESSSLSATSLRNEAMARANDAWSKADNVATEAYSLCAKIDQYSVGEYSQAYGLTLEQAHNILELGMIYVPTQSHKEEYVYTQDGESRTYKREFSPGYLYQWDYIADNDIGIGWATVGESPSVYFHSVEPAIAERLAYWYTNSSVITDLKGNVDTYASYTLYKWEEDHWVAVATLAGNVNNRLTSEICQTTNAITMGVTNPRGCIAALDVRLTDTEATTQQFSSWKTGEEEKMASVKTIAGPEGSSVVISALQKNGDNIEEMASLTLGVAEGTDGISGALTMDAKNIVLNGNVAFTNTKTNEDGNNVTWINGATIETGTLSASQITTGTLNAEDVTIVNLDASQITTGTLNADRIDVDDLSAIAAKIGSWEITDDGIKCENTGLSSDVNLTQPSLMTPGDVSAVKIYSGTANIMQASVVVEAALWPSGDTAFVTYTHKGALVVDAATAETQNQHMVIHAHGEKTFNLTLEYIDSSARSEASLEWKAPEGYIITNIGIAEMSGVEGLEIIYFNGNHSTYGAIVGANGNYDGQQIAVTVEYQCDGTTSVMSERFSYEDSTLTGEIGIANWSSEEYWIDGTIEIPITYQYKIFEDGHGFMVLDDGSLYASMAKLRGGLTLEANDDVLVDITSISSDFNNPVNLNDEINLNGSVKANGASGLSGWITSSTGSQAYYLHFEQGILIEATFVPPENGATWLIR